MTDRKPWQLRLQATLEHTALRVTMSLLIVVSLSPIPWVDELWWLFLGLFALELAARIVAFPARRGPRGGETFVLLLDFVATLSFLPHSWLGHQARLLRLFRLAALLGYWLPYVRELVNLTMRPERWRSADYAKMTG